MPGSLEYVNGTARSNASLWKAWPNGATYDKNDSTHLDTQCNASSSSAILPQSPFTLLNGSRSTVSPAYPILPPESLLVRQTPTAGRGVFAAITLASGTLVEVSHVLLFPAKEYNDHGRHTQLDNYTYVWEKGTEGKTMALALGLGSLFNHTKAIPNTNYTLDRLSGTIQYRLSRDVLPGEELFISYGTGRMWWETNVSNGKDHASSAEDDDESDLTLEKELIKFGQLGLETEELDTRQQKRREDRRRLTHLSNHISSRLPLSHTSPNLTPPLISAPKLIGPDAAPLWRITAAVDPTTTPLELMAVWAVDIDPRKSSNFMQFSRSIARRLRAAEEGGDGQEHIRREQERNNQVEEDDDDIDDDEDDSGDEDESMKHLRIFHRMGQGSSLSALVCKVQDVPSIDEVTGLLESADVVSDGHKPKPFQVQVPRVPAPSRLRLPEWRAFWPVAVKHGKVLESLAKSSLAGISAGNQCGSTPGIVDRGADAKLWTKEATQWTIENFRRCLTWAKQAKERGELPVAVHVTPAYSDAEASKLGPDGHPWIQVDAWDTRQSERNPIKHGVTNAIRDVAKLRSDRDRERLQVLGAKVAALNREGQVEVSPNRQGSREDSSTTAGRISSGQDYLLNNLTLFTTHEPCVSCCMALVHSRVRTIFFIKPSPGAGGLCGSGLEAKQRCSHAEDGGPYAIQEQAGLNHHFDVWKWVGDPKQLIEDDLDGLLDINGLDA